MNIATDPMHQFLVTRLFDFRIGGFDLSFTNSAAFMLAGVLGVTGFFLWAFSSPRTVPNRAQSIGEMWYGFVRGIIRDVNGDAGMAFFPLVFTLFSFILAANMIGMIPWFFTSTSHIAVTGALALFTIGLVVVVGLIRNGFGFFRIFVPSGVPAVLLLIVVPIEILSFLSRPISLGMRLFANMLGGHVALKVFAGFVPQLAAGLGATGMVMGGVLVMPLIIGVTALEFLVAFLQAYVFAMLTCVYLNDALHAGHH
ncbi:F0F1 ATP synthase subunit A [bacterium]|nr:F0F1 ATP synthase subunit A [bacterium]